MNNEDLALAEGGPDLRVRAVLDGIADGEVRTQRDLARRAGVALGLANALVKRLAGRGLIRVRRLSARRLAYALTPKGAREQARGALRYMAWRVGTYREVRHHLKPHLARLRAQGVRRVAICGTDDLAEILYLTLRELGLSLAGVVEEGARPARERWLGHEVRSLPALAAMRPDAVLVSRLEGGEALAQRVRAAGVAAWTIPQLRALTPAARPALRASRSGASG